jgi:phosphomannomutase/phosphoglucomutase
MEKFQKVAEFPDANLTTIDGIRADFADGWGLVRCSNTTPCLVLRFDADNEEALEKIKEEFRAQILAVDSSLKLPF